MPLDSKVVDELKSQLAASRKRPLNFGICLSKKPEDTAFVMHRTKSPDALAREAKKSADTTKATFGTIETVGKVINLTCIDPPPSGLSQKMKLFFKAAKLSMKVRILDQNGTLLEEDGEDDGEGGDGDDLDDRDGIDDIEWKALKQTLEPKIAIALKLDNADTSRIRAAWGVALESADESDFANAVRIAQRIVPLLEQTTPTPSGDTGGGDDSAKWRVSSDKLRPLVTDVLTSGKGDTGKIRGVWQFAEGKAAAGDYAAALSSLKPLVQLLAAAQSATKTEAQGEVPKGLVGDRVGGAGLLDELKSKIPALKEAFVIFPERATEGTDWIKAMPGLVQANDLDTARVTLSKLDYLLTEATRWKERNAEAKKAVESVLGDYKSRMSEVMKVPEVFAAATEVRQELKAVSEEVEKLVAAGTFIPAEPLLEKWRISLVAFEDLKTGMETAKKKHEDEYAGIRRLVHEARKIDGPSPDLAKMSEKFKALELQVKGFVNALDYPSATDTLMKVAVAADEMTREKARNDEAKLRVEPLVVAYNQRYVALSVAALPAAPGVDELRKAFTDAQGAVKKLTDASDFLGAERIIGTMKDTLEIVEARKVEYDKDKKTFDDELAGISDDLARTLKIGSVTPDMGNLRKRLLEQKGKMDNAVTAFDYKTANPALLELAERLARIDKAKERYDEEKAEWEKEIAAARERIAFVEGCGPINQPLDKLKADFGIEMTETRARAKVNDYPEARKRLRAALVIAEQFLLDKGKLDTTASGEFDKTRKEGAKGIPVFSSPASDGGSTILGVETAMENNDDLGKSKGLQALVEQSKLLDALFNQANAGASPDAAANVRSSINNIFTPIANYQKEHKSDSRSKADRDKFAQAAALDLHHRLQITQLDSIIPVLTKLDSIDSTAIAANETEATKAMGWLDGVIGSDASPGLKAAARAKRVELLRAMMKVAPNLDGLRKVADMSGPKFKESFERQSALGPLLGTAKGSKAREKHGGTKIQNLAGAENIDRSRLLANRLVADDGTFELAALFAFDPNDLADDKPASKQMARALTKLRESPEALAMLESIPAPKPGSAAAQLVRATLGLGKDEVVTEAHTRKAALSSLLSELRQGDVGSCFATQTAIRIHDTDPAAYLKDISQMMSEGKLTRIVNGEEMTVNVQTKMSDAELKDHAVKLSRGPTPDLKGSRMGGTLAPPTKLEEAPAFKGAFTALGIPANQGTGAMNAALVDMQASAAFRKNQNEKAIRAAVRSITDETKRKQVLAQAMKLVTDDRASVKIALTAAMADPDPANLPPAPVPLPEQGQANTAYDGLLDAPDFDVEPNLVVEALIRGKLGLTEAEVLRAEACEKLRAEVMTHPDMRSAKTLALPGDKDLLDKLKLLETEDKAVKWEKIRQLEPMKQQAFDSYLGEDQNRMARAFEYTLTSLAEKSTIVKRMGGLQEQEIIVVKGEMTDLANGIVGDPAFKKTKVKIPEVDDIMNRLMTTYQRVFAKGTSAGYDASVGTALSNDGSSSRGVWCLYDTQGIDDPDRWIKIDNSKDYRRLVQGMMMLAWSEEYGKAKDDKITKLSRRIADDLSERLVSDGFSEKLAKRAKQWQNDETVEPWRIGGGGEAPEVIEVVESRTPKRDILGTPTNAKDLMKKTSQHLKDLWDAPLSDLKSNGEKDGEAFGVAANILNNHVFSLVPGEPKLKALIEDPRGIDVALDDHIVKEKAKWSGAQTGTMLRTQEDVAEQIYLMAGRGTPANIISAAWTAIKDNPTMQRLNAHMKSVYMNVGRTDAEADAILSGHIIRNLVPPVAPADLDKKLLKVAKALDVPDDLLTVVTEAAKAALVKIDATKAGMTDIKTEITRAMAAEGIPTDGATQGKVTAALREPQGMVFADSNWGDAEHRIKFAMVVNPITGDMEMWQMNEDGSNPGKMKEDDWVKKQWDVTV